LVNAGRSNPYDQILISLRMGAIGP
jgi:hypothetical protein